MADVVYLFGAGINRTVRAWRDIQPPLATDFFQQAFKHHRIGQAHYRDKLKPIIDYIHRFWKLSIQDLETGPFDLEACYTLIQLQALDARLKGDRDAMLLLSEIEYRLTALLAEYLSDFEHFTHSSEAFRLLGEIVYSEKPAVLTFNYDTLLESTIESASRPNINIPSQIWGTAQGMDEVSDEELPYSHYNWNRPLAYGVKFDEVQLSRAGIPTFVSAEHFYSHQENELYNPPLLKLHGSINWFVYTGIKRYSFIEDEAQESRMGKTVLYRGNWWQNETPDLHGEIVQPIIITPVLNKELNQNSIIRQTWIQALKELSECNKLIVGGYSFPPTDFHTRRLFLEAFSEHSLVEIIVINPDTRVVQLVKDLCHFKRPVLACRDLDEFVSLYNHSQ